MVYFGSQVWVDVMIWVSSRYRDLGLGMGLGIRFQCRARVRICFLGRCWDLDLESGLGFGQGPIGMANRQVENESGDKQF